jgi:hypothetical protein
MKKRLASTEKHRSILWKPRMLGEEKPCFHTGESSFGNTYQNPAPRFWLYFSFVKILLLFIYLFLILFIFILKLG